MKIRFTRDVLVNFYNRRLDEAYDKNFTKWKEIDVESIQGKDMLVICTAEGDTLMDVPSNSFVKLN